MVLVPVVNRMTIPTQNDTFLYFFPNLIITSITTNATTNGKLLSTCIYVMELETGMPLLITVRTS